MAQAADIHPGMQVYDAHDALIGAVKELITRDKAERLRASLGKMSSNWQDPDPLPPDEDFPYVVVDPTTPEASRQSRYGGFYVPAHAIVRVQGDAARLSGTLADIVNLGWHVRPGFLP